MISPPTLRLVHPHESADVPALLDAHGAVLFRGFGIDSAERFERFVASHVNEWMGYVDRASKRSAVSGRILTSTDTPAAFSIPLHCESSFTARWPQRIFFYCHTPSAVGGRTPLADMQAVYRMLDPVVRARFENEGVMYYRNFGPGVGMDWRDVFQVADRAALERYCASEAVRVEWLDDEHLRTVQIRPATLSHPRTGERLWFNHALALHASSLDPALRQTLLRQRGEAGLPHNTYFGNGDPIPDDVIAHVRQVHESQQILFDWQAGDVLLLDNMRMAHGREPFSGPRAVYAAMGNPLSWREIGATIEAPAAWPRFADGASATPRDPEAPPRDSEPPPLDDRASLRDWFIAAVAAELGQDAVDPALGFAELGGDSISAVMVIDQLMDRFGLELSLDTLLEPRSLEEIISGLEA